MTAAGLEPTSTKFLNENSDSQNNKSELPKKKKKKKKNCDR